MIGLVVLGATMETLSPSVWAADKPFIPVVHVADAVWVQYYLEERKIKDYWFLKGGARAIQGAL
ncbi:MAG: hypothetical protein ACYC3A_01040 [Halothiobacillus sp.]